MTDHETQRTEAFSDGVFAIAITLLILEIKVPQLASAPTGSSLLQALIATWPSFVAFLSSFWVILVMWVNHHELFRLVRRSDHRFFFANGLLLLLVTFVPYPTAVLARYLGTSAQEIAAAFYCGTFVLISSAYILLFETVARGRRSGHEREEPVISRIRRTYRGGFVVYLAAALVSNWNAWLGLALCSSLWLVWVSLLYRGDSTGEHPRNHIDSISPQS